MEGGEVERFWGSGMVDRGFRIEPGPPGNEDWRVGCPGGVLLRGVHGNPMGLRGPSEADAAGLGRRRLCTCERRVTPAPWGPRMKHPLRNGLEGAGMYKAIRRSVLNAASTSGVATLFGF